MNSINVLKRRVWNEAKECECCDPPVKKPHWRMAQGDEKGFAWSVKYEPPPLSFWCFLVIGRAMRVDSCAMAYLSKAMDLFDGIDQMFMRTVDTERYQRLVMLPMKELIIIPTPEWY